MQAAPSWGTEDFEVSADEAKCTVELHVGGGVTRLDTVLGLAGELGASSYVLDAGPGGTLSVTFEEHTAHLSLPGMGREFQLGMPRVVMDNNVFCHYQVLIGMYDARRGGVQTSRRWFQVRSRQPHLRWSMLGY